MIQALLALLPNAVNAVGNYAAKVQDRKAAAEAADAALEQALADAKIKHVQTAQVGEIDWDMMAMKNSTLSWKDEMWTIVLAIPMVMCFIPFLSPYVALGFAAVSTMPVWYQGALTLAIAAAFGKKAYSDWQFTVK